MALFDELQDIEDALAAPDLEERRDWAMRHRAILQRTLEAPNFNHIQTRVYRAKCWQEREMVVFSLLQYFNVPEGGVTLKAFVARGYQHYPAHRAELLLLGRYSLDDLVVFLQLDTIDPADIEWADETRYILVPENASVVDALIRKTVD